MDSSDEDTFDESNATEDEEEIDEIFEDDEIDEDNQSSMSLDQDETNEAESAADHFMEDNWPPQNIPMAVPDKSNKKKPGIIFLSSIPPGFNVSTSIAFFSQFGKIGRVFLQPGKRKRNFESDQITIILYLNKL